MFKPEEIKVLEEARKILLRKQRSWDQETDVILLHKTQEGLAMLIDPTFTPLI